MRIKLYFIAANIVLVSMVFWILLPNRLFILRGYENAVSLRERQLSVREENFRMYDENIALLAALQAENDRQIIIQPAGELGGILNDVRDMLYSRGLRELEFYAGEQAVHYVYGRHIRETRVTIVAEGYFYRIDDFISDLVHHYRFFRLERIQISDEFELSRLWVGFSLYEKIY